MKKILVLDDEVNIRLLLEEELKDEGYDVITAATGEEALKILEKERIDLVTVDIDLPGINGLEFAGRVRKNLPELKMILLTAYTHYQNDLSSWAANAYIVKSVDLTELKEKIRELIDE